MLIQRLFGWTAALALVGFLAAPGIAQESEEGWFDWGDEDAETGAGTYDYDEDVEAFEEEGLSNDDYGYYDDDYDWETEDEGFDSWYGDTDRDWDLF